LAALETLVVNKVTLISDTTASASDSITIEGTANTITTTAGEMAPMEALVIDASAVTAGTTLQLNNVEFGVITGENLLIRGGAGQNKIFTGAGSQDIMCGADDDQLYAGGGDDTVGSAGGNDLIYGESGNDTVFGGEGDDQLHGGSELDKATYSDVSSNYTITRDEGKTYIHNLTTNETDTLINVETIEFSDRTYTVDNAIHLTKIASLYEHIFDRQADIGGFQYWAHNYSDGANIGDIVVSCLLSQEYRTTTGNDINTMNNADRVEVLYDALLGRAGETEGKNYWVEQMNNGATLQNIAESFVNSIEMQGIYLTEQGWSFIA
jgi:Ca2+-binding RTX toxin-like protein